jgi:hypothetical protein
MSSKCPVCDEPIHAPVKAKVAGKEVAVCCESCARIIKASPDKYARYIKGK